MRWDCEMRLKFSNFEESLQLLFCSVCHLCFTASISKVKATQILVNKLRIFLTNCKCILLAHIDRDEPFARLHTLIASWPRIPLVGNVMLVSRSVPKIWSLETGAWSLELGDVFWKFFWFFIKKNALFLCKKKCYESLLELASRSSRLTRKAQASSSAQISKLQDRLGFYGSVLPANKHKQNRKM